MLEMMEARDLEGIWHYRNKDDIKFIWVTWEIIQHLVKTIGSYPDL